MKTEIPIFLENYDWFEKIQEWKQTTSDYAERRSWSLRSYGKSGVCCRLEWILNEQMASFERAGLSPQEAVYRNLEEFHNLESDYLWIKQ